MKPRLVDLLVCPIDCTHLELIEWESSKLSLSPDDIGRIRRMGLDPLLFSKEIKTGVLVNRAQKIYYPVHEGVPRLLPFATGVAHHFAKVHAERIALELPQYTLPCQEAVPGEKTVLRSFSSEWVNYDWNERSYWHISPDVMYRSVRFMLDLNAKSVSEKLVLEVGVGIAGIADYMARAEGCELVGIDLSHAVDPAYKHFGKNVFLHLVQASAFAPPVKGGVFDLVYSWGVLHHTFSTKTAFARISRLAKVDGRLYVWVYSPYDEQRTLGRRTLMLAERVVRPLCWRLPERLQAVLLLPFIPLYLIHQNLYVRSLAAGYARYGWREAMHAARDRFTPRYAHRHTEDEVCSWFREAGYETLTCSSTRNPPDFVPLSFRTATAVEGVRR